MYKLFSVLHIAAAVSQCWIFLKTLFPTFSTIRSLAFSDFSNFTGSIAGVGATSPASPFPVSFIADSGSSFGSESSFRSFSSVRIVFNPSTPK
ncbi:hypothetical protein YC2023_115982 [Brassica napus]